MVGHGLIEPVGGAGTTWMRCGSNQMVVARTEFMTMLTPPGWSCRRIETNDL
jgi:hypothetical protein